ncbi:hypothetical protein Droror1_Dr00016352 [Drosera rotundifolia]
MEEYCEKYAKPEHIGAVSKEKSSSDEELSDEEYESGRGQVAVELGLSRHQVRVGCLSELVGRRGNFAKEQQDLSSPMSQATARGGGRRRELRGIDGKGVAREGVSGFVNEARLGCVWLVVAGGGLRQ